MRVRLAIFSLLAIAVLGAGSGQAREVWDDDWIEVRTESFEFVSAIGERRTLELAERLENFRQLVVSQVSPQRFDAGAPIRVYLFRRPLRDIGLTRDLGGYFLPMRRAGVIILRKSWNMEQWIQHEYVHYLVRSRDARDYPTWLDEGIAELLSTVEVQGVSFSLGKAPRYAISRLSNVRWIDYADILGLGDPRDLSGVHRTMFYNQSWLLLHYLIWGRSDRNYPRDANEYLRRVGLGIPSETAFEQSFDLEIEELRPTLRTYWSGAFYTQGTFATPTGPPPIKVRSLTPDEVALAVGEIARARGNLATAREYFESALRLNETNENARVALVDAFGPDVR